VVCVDDYAFNLLRERLKKNIGFNAPWYEEKHLKRRLAVRMRALNVDDYRDYIQLLSTHKGEYKKLFAALTINVTEFFRDTSTFEAIKRDLLPGMIEAKEKKGRRFIRIWSPGCSDGKEPYSIAILLREALGEKADEWSTIIYASDIDSKMLGKAEAGEYGAEEVDGVAEKYLRRYFTRTRKGYAVREDIRNMIKFERRDLLSDKMHGSLDMVVCRNVVIYFSRSTKEKLYMDFYNSLHDGGFLILGKTETLFGEARTKFTTYNHIERIYIKD
jgi:chemotaxis protein methyltransferase CheR